MRNLILASVAGVSAAALAGCATTALPPPTTSYARQDCASQPDLSKALGLTPKMTVSTPITAATACLAGKGGPTPYVVYALPSELGDKTFDVGAGLEGVRIFAPEVSLLNAEGAVTRTFPREQFLYRGAVYSVQFRARPGERYLMVTAAPDLVGKAYQSIAIGTSTTTVYTGVGTASWTSGVDSSQHRTFSYDGVAQVSVFDTRDAAAPCYACVFPPESSPEAVNCATMGVFAPLVGIVGAMQASEALRLLAGVGQSLAGRLLMLDGRTMEWTQIRVGRHAACSVCAGRPEPAGAGPPQGG